MAPRRNKDGQWFDRPSIKKPDGTTVRLYVMAPKHENTKAALKEAIRRAEDRVLHPEKYLPPEPIKEVLTLHDFVESRYRPHLRHHNKPGTVVSYGSLLDLHLLPWFGTWRLNEIQPLDIEAYKTAQLDVVAYERAMLEQGRAGDGRTQSLSKKSVDLHLMVLNRILVLAVEWKVIEEKPKVKRFLPKSGRVEFWAFEEADRLLAAAAHVPGDIGRDQHVAPGDWGRMVTLALKTGMRIGELRALRTDNAGLFTGRVNVCEAEYKGHIGLPKGNKTREIRLSPAARAAVRAQRHLRGPFLFCDLDGHMLREKVCTRALKTACKLAGLEPAAWHRLRHTFASHLVMRGHPLPAVQALMGHADLQVTMKYAHLAPEVTEYAVDSLDAPAPRFGSGLAETVKDDASNGSQSDD